MGFKDFMSLENKYLEGFYQGVLFIIAIILIGKLSFNTIHNELSKDLQIYLWIFSSIVILILLFFIIKIFRRFSKEIRNT